MTCLHPGFAAPVPLRASWRASPLAAAAATTTTALPSTRAPVSRAPLRSQLLTSPSSSPSPSHSPSPSPSPATTTPTAANAANAALFKCLNCDTKLPPSAPPLTRTLPPTCPTCSAPLPRRAGYVDLTHERHRPILQPPFFELLLGPRTQVRQALFELPQVAFAYERGWRGNFARAGFPGPAMEADLALDFLLPAAYLLDVSCGSGILTRRLAAASATPPPTAGADTVQLQRIVAMDVSHPMLVEAVARARADVRVHDVDFVRADVARLPFADGAFDAVHAGAALHCWPRLQDGLRDIRRILAPGGRFFATTFLNTAYWSRNKAGQTLITIAERLQEAGVGPKPYRFFRQQELLYLLRAAGFQSVEVEVLGGGCAIVRAIKGES